MPRPDLKVVELHSGNFRDPVFALREIADGIERGEYGDVGIVGVALLGSTMECFGIGRDAEGPSTALLFHAAFQRLSKSLEEYGR